MAVFTNLSRDHLDYHGSEADYLQAKKRLFDDLSKDAFALTNLDDPYGARIVGDTPARVWRIGHKDRFSEADFTWRITDESLDGLALEIDGDHRRFRLAGAYNGFNLCATYAAARALGLEANEALDLLAHCPPVRGRFEQLVAEDGRTVIIDYAHTPDALENVLMTARTAVSQQAQLWCLFGCGGDRDRGKRPQMGAIAERCADRVIVTSDNPRSEGPEEILNDIREGFEKPDRAAWLADRFEAIAYAAAHMAPGDTLVLAGKGHETTQLLEDRTIHFDDREEARHAFGISLSDTLTKPTGRKTKNHALLPHTLSGGGIRTARIPGDRIHHRPGRPCGHHCAADCPVHRTTHYPVAGSHKQLGEQVREGIHAGVVDHTHKQGTPSMGGLIILIAVLGATLLWGAIGEVYVWLIMLATAWMGVFGFVDDYIKVVKRDKSGMPAGSN